MKQTPKAKKKTAGRPKAEFDLSKVHLFGKFKATYDTMADYFGVSRETIKRRMADDPEFCASYKRGQAECKLKIYEAQYKLATEKLNPAMLIWLGKVFLNQREDAPIETDTEQTNGLTEYLKGFQSAVLT